MRALILLVVLLVPLFAVATPAVACIPEGVPITGRCGSGGHPSQAGIATPGVGGAVLFVEDETEFDTLTIRRTGAVAWAGPASVGIARDCLDQGHDDTCEEDTYIVNARGPGAGVGLFVRTSSAGTQACRSAAAASGCTDTPALA